ncbi:DUF4912 domain-containing protein [Brevibacillus sp. TJ4]|uniref:DUF4912 domain-containing protein n=1 Tax=Brevibacillus sp. TJ4 TaxID=3234853 RepID=UPI0037CF5792
MLEKIHHLRSQAVPTAQIAKECGLTVGQVECWLKKEESSVREKAGMYESQQSTQSDPDQQWRLPSFYGGDCLKLMVQGPTVLFAYWEITWPRMRMVASYLQSDYRQIQKGLRLYDVTDRLFDGHNAHSYRDVRVLDDATSWYVYGMEANRTYIADFGLFDKDQFCPILRSEPVVTPRNTKAVWGEPLIEPVTDPARPAWFENFSSYSLYCKS